MRVAGVTKVTKGYTEWVEYTFTGSQKNHDRTRFEWAQL